MSLSERLVWSSIRLGARVFYGDTTQADWIYEKVRRPRTLWLVARNMLNYRLGRPRIAGLVTLGVEPVFGCNLKCKYCWGGLEASLGGSRPPLMDMDLFKKAVDEAPDTVETVTFGSVGEPLMNPRLCEMIAYAAASGRRTALYSNGTLLTGERAEALAASPLDALSISMEPDAATAREFRGIDRDRIRENVRAFAAKRRPGMVLKLSMVMHPGNMDSVARAWDGWEHIVEGIKVTTMMDLTGTRACAQHTACSEVWRGNLNVQTNGEVTPCCLDVQGALSVGNLRETRLSDLVNNAAHRRMLEGFVAGTPPERCMHCTEFSGEGVPVKVPKRPVAGKKAGG